MNDICHILHDKFIIHIFRFWRVLGRESLTNHFIRFLNESFTKSLILSFKRIVRERIHRILKSKNLSCWVDWLFRNNYLQSSINFSIKRMIHEWFTNELIELWKESFTNDFGRFIRYLRKSFIMNLMKSFANEYVRLKKNHLRTNQTTYKRII